MSSSDRLHPLVSVDSYGIGMRCIISVQDIGSAPMQALERSNGVSSIGRPKCQPRFPLEDPRVFGAYSGPLARCIYSAVYDRIWQELCEAVMIIDFRVAVVTGRSIEFVASSARSSLMTPFLPF